MKKLIQLAHSKLKLLGFLSIGVLVFLVIFGLIFFFKKTTTSEFKAFSLDITHTIKRAPVSLSSSLTENMEKQLADKVAEKITSAATSEDVKFNSPEEFASFVTTSLDENMKSYEEDIQKELVRDIHIRAHVQRNTTERQKEVYLHTIKNLISPSAIPESKQNATALDGITFYTTLRQKLETLPVPLEYYYIHHELIRIAITRVFAYKTITQVIDTDPMKAALMMKFLASTQEQLNLASRVVSEKVALQTR